MLTTTQQREVKRNLAIHYMEDIIYQHLLLSGVAAKSVDLATMLEGTRKGYWTPGPQLMKEMVKAYAESVAGFGYSESAYTGGNKELQELVTQNLNAPGDRELLEQYRAAFEYPGKGLEAGFEFETPEVYAEQVYKKIIAPKSIKPRYTLGKGVATLPWIHRLLSKRAIERLWQRLLKVKAR